MPESNLVPHSAPGLSRELGQLSGRGRRDVERAVAAEYKQAAVVSARVRARCAVSAAAAQADAMLSGVLNSLPIYDETDALFKAQLKQATRAGLIADVLGF